MTGVLKVIVSVKRKWVIGKLPSVAVILLVSELNLLKMVARTVVTTSVVMSVLTLQSMFYLTLD